MVPRDGALGAPAPSVDRSAGALLLVTHARTPPSRSPRRPHADGVPLPRRRSAARPGDGPAPRPATSSTIAGVDPAVVAFVPVERFWTPRRDISMAELRAAIEGRHRRPATRARGSRRPLVSVAGARRHAGADDADGVLARVVTGRRGLEARARARCPPAAVPTHGPGAPGRRPQPLRARACSRPRQLAPAAQLPGAAANPRPVRSRPHVDPRGRAATSCSTGRSTARRSCWARAPATPGTAASPRIISRTCCTADGGDAITTRRRGPRGAVRVLLSRADLTVVNHEGPAPDDFAYHPGGLVFTFDPALLAGLDRRRDRYREPR